MKSSFFRSFYRGGDQDLLVARVFWPWLRAEGTSNKNPANWDEEKLVNLPVETLNWDFRCSKWVANQSATNLSVDFLWKFDWFLKDRTHFCLCTKLYPRKVWLWWTSSYLHHLVGVWKVVRRITSKHALKYTSVAKHMHFENMRHWYTPWHMDTNGYML